MPSIQTLPENVIDQIAAGEVVENPVSVIKELVENAIDAGSSKISIEILKGGLEKIRVSDNGSGIEKEELKLALFRHATSKIQKMDDLYALSSMGFRGEALASIASISKLTIKSSVNDSGLGYEIASLGGKISDIQMAPRQKGTDVILTDLFYNVPARLKFQKSPTFLVSQATKLIEALRLCYPLVDMEFISNGKKLFCFFSTSNDFLDGLEIRVKEHLGALFHQSSEKIDTKSGKVQIKGFLGSSKMSRASKRGQYLFINERWVQSNLISEIVKESYRTAFNEREFPSFVLHLFLDKECVDVNVHPQKKEVHFSDPKKLRENILSCVSKEMTYSLPTIKVGAFEKKHYEGKEVSLWDEMPQQEPSFFEEQKAFEKVALVGIYYFVQSEGVLWVLNLKRALVEMLMGAFEENSLEAQKLIVPYLFDLSRADHVKLLYMKDFLFKMGFDLRAMGETTIAVDAHPAFIAIKDAHVFIKELLDTFSKTEDLNRILKYKEKKLKKNLQRVVSDKVFSLSEADALLHQIRAPYDERIFKEITKEDVSVIFGDG